MNIFIYLSLIFTLIFSNENQDSLYINNKIIISDIEVYGGLDESSISTNIQIITNDYFNVNGNNNFEDFLQSTASLNYAGGTSRAKYFQLRGLGELSQFSGEGPPHFYIGYIIDNIDFSGIGMIGQLYDMKQIEIFKGPQSSLYGPNAMAGIINLVSNKPSNIMTFNFNTSLYSKNGQTFNLSSSIPITRKLLSRITISNNYNDGFIKNVSNENNIIFDSNSKDEMLLRYQLRYNANSNFYINSTLYFINLKNKYDVWTPDNNGFISYSDFQGLDEQKTYATSFKINYILNNITFTSITTYSKNDMNYSYDGDWGNNNFWSNEPYNWNVNNPNYWGPWQFTDITNRKRNSYSQEFRIKQQLNNNIILTSGLYYSNLKEIDKRDGWLFAGYANNIDSKFNIFNYAIYSQLSLPLSNKLFLSSTIRNDINKINQNLKYEYYDYDNYPYYYYYYPQQGEYNKSIKDNNLIGGNIKIDYQYNNSLFINSSISRGYKTSGVNQTQAPFLADSLKTYNTEYCNNIDFGINYIDNNYNFEFSIFYMHRYNPQLRLSYQLDPSDPTSFDYATFNAKHGYNYGFELNINLKISNEILVNSYLSYLNTYVSQFNYLGTSYGNRELAHSPKHKYGLNIEYDMSKKIKGLILNISSNFVGKFYFEEQNNIESNPYNLIDISANYNIDNITISLWSKNITNTKYAIRGYQFVLDPTYQLKDFQTFGNPRTFGVTLNYNI